MSILDDVLCKAMHVPAIVIVRDPRAVLWSWAKRAEVSIEQWIGGHLNDACERYVEYGRGWWRAVSGKHASRILLVQYEQLCLDSEKLNRKIFDFIGLDSPNVKGNFQAYFPNVYGRSISTSYLREYEHGFSNRVAREILAKTADFNQFCWSE
jgi:hypothetical protein